MRTVPFSGSRMLPQAGNPHVRLHSELRIVKGKETKLVETLESPRKRLRFRGEGRQRFGGRGCKRKPLESRVSRMDAGLVFVAVQTNLSCLEGRAWWVPV